MDPIMLRRLRRRALLFALKMRSKIAGIGAVRRLDYHGARLLIRADSHVEFETRAKSCAKEPETTAWLDRFAGKGAVLYDVGANIGAYSLVAAARGARVVAFEPAYQNFNQLNRNVTMNRFDDRVDAYACGLGAETKIAKFSFLDLSTGTSKGFTNEQGYYHLPHDKPAVEKLVMVFALDEFVERFKTPLPTMLKVDVDGGEAEVIDGARKTLASMALKTVLIEIDDRTGRKDGILASLTAAGFVLEAKHTREPHVDNHLFIRRP
jgi:FkbM family methyltransferase